MAREAERLERFIHGILPLLVMSVYMTWRDKGFDTLLPVAACTIYAVLQPCFQFFVFDRIRDVLFDAQRQALFYWGAVALYVALALACASFFI